MSFSTIPQGNNGLQPVMWDENNNNNSNNNITTQTLSTSSPLMEVENVMEMLSPLARIYKKLDVVQEPFASKGYAAGYIEEGGGTLVAISNKVYLITVSNIFTKQCSEYFLMINKQPIIPFKYVVEETTCSPKCVEILIGRRDENDRSIHFINNSDIHGDVYFITPLPETDKESDQK